MGLPLPLFLILRFKLPRLPLPCLQLQRFPLPLYNSEQKIPFSSLMCICGSDVVPCLLHDGGSRLSLSKALMQEYDRTEAKDFLCSQSLCFLEKIELTGIQNQYKKSNKSFKTSSKYHLQNCFKTYTKNILKFAPKHAPRNGHEALMQEYDRTEAKDFLCSQSLVS